MVRIRGSGGRPEDDTRNPGRFPISQDFGGGWTVDPKGTETRGAWLLRLLFDAPLLPAGVGGCVYRPYHVEKVLRTIPVASNNRQKTD